MPTLVISNTVYNASLRGSHSSAFFNTFRANTGTRNVLGTDATDLQGGAGQVGLNIYKGVAPESFSEFSDRTQRESDLLIEFILPHVINYIDLGNANNVSRRFLIGRHPSNRAAIASGTATWFMMAMRFSTSLGDKVALMGSVGTPGSGADLVIPNNNIVANVNYQSSGLVINFPYSFNV